MKDITKLNLIKAAHTGIWGIMVAAIFYLLYAGIMDRFDIYMYISGGLIIVEIITLVTNNWVCPFTDMAKRYLDDWKLGDDIFLPRWIAVYNREIFTPPLVLGIIIVIVRIVQRI